MFDIRLTANWVDQSVLGDAGLYGEIVLGEHTERFVSLIGYWSPLDYQRQWRTGIRRLIRELVPSCVITSIDDPDNSEILRWWLLYPLGDVVAVRESALEYKRSRTKFSTEMPFLAIPPRRLLSEDGFEISEWQLPVLEFEGFLERQSQSGR